MRKLFLFASLSLVALFLSGESKALETANTYMGVSPIRIETMVQTGWSVTKSITFYNNSTASANISITTEDCYADEWYGTPKCNAYVGTGTIDPESLATWIQFTGSKNFSIGPKSNRVVNFTITPPNNALPGGHYGAIFFNNSEGGVNPANTSSVTMVRRIGVLLLVNVNGKIVYNTSLGGITIASPDATIDEPTGIIDEILNAPNDQKIDKIKEALQVLNPFWEEPKINDDGNFLVDFKIPLANSGNTHVKPTGSIELYDEDGLIIKKVGKESIKTPEGVVVGDRIVDYIPINDEGGNVLPGTERTFISNWKGFAYESFENGERVIKFMTPSEHYTSLTAASSKYLLPWEKLSIKMATKKIRAKIHLEYRTVDNKITPMDEDRDVYIKYTYIEKGLNYGALLIIGLTIIIAWFLIRRRDKRIHELEEDVTELEVDVDELEEAKRAARTVLEKKGSKGIKEAEKVLEWTSSPVTKKPRAPRKKKTEDTPSE